MCGGDTSCSCVDRPVAYSSCYYPRSYCLPDYCEPVYCEPYYYPRSYYLSRYYSEYERVVEVVPIERKYTTYETRVTWRRRGEKAKDKKEEEEEK